MDKTKAMLCHRAITRSKDLFEVLTTMDRYPARFYRRRTIRGRGDKTEGNCRNISTLLQTKVNELPTFSLAASATVIYVHVRRLS
jgi:hypothetical protein